jgi:uncharacterized repeat protein (TIGR01451 family)
MTIARHVKYASLALLALSSVGVLQGAYANGTPSGTTISNTATVDYSVGSVAQTQISAGVTFVVDTRIDLTVSEESTNATVTHHGLSDVVTTFRVANTGNSLQGYRLSATNESGGALFLGTDTVDVSNLRTFVDSNANDVYEPLLDTATHIDSLATDPDVGLESVVVFIVADMPAGSTNQYANVRLTAQAAVPGTNGATLETATPLTDADNKDVVQIVFADTGRDATEFALDQYALALALSVTKNVVVVSDAFGSSNPKAIPGAVMQYTILVTNSSTTLPATGVTVTDNIPANTSFVSGSIRLNGGALPDTGNFIAGPPARVVVDAGSVPINNGTAEVTFQVTINTN